jgi:hypothetical protein
MIKYEKLTLEELLLKFFEIYSNKKTFDIKEPISINNDTKNELKNKLSNQRYFFYF